MLGRPPWTFGTGCGASARYEPVFRDNEINGKVETKLTVEDLKELGISAWGTARMLLDAIAQLCADANTEIAAASHPSHEGGATPNGRHMVPLRTSYDSASTPRISPEPVILVRPRAAAMACGSCRRSE
jgi:SAM domain (Sterile alpha motif)